MRVTLRDIEADLRDSTREWRWHASCVIQDIPPGFLCSYGEIAREANRRASLKIIARNIGWLRGYLYGRTKRQTIIPLHRVAKSSDTRCVWDSKKTRRDAKALRTQEGSWKNPRWWTF